MADKSEKYLSHNHTNADGTYTLPPSKRCACVDCCLEDGFTKEEAAESQAKKERVR